MGSASSKFKKYVQNGDEYAAMQVYQSSPELKKSFDPNLSYGESRHHNTAMHYAARYGMKHLLRTFLNDLGGDPNKRNAFDETVLHSACSAGTAFPPTCNHISISCVQIAGTGTSSSNSTSNNTNQNPSDGTVLTASAQERRAACIALLLQWRGGRLPSSDEKERIQLDALDREGNTALHLAAGAGLLSGVRLLLSSGAHSLTRDSRGRTAAQRALSGGHARIAALIERAMIFSDESIDWCSERWGWTQAELNEEEAEEAAASTNFDSHEGLRPQELREAKDRLLVDTSDMLRVSLFTAEALLRDNEWCRDVLVEKWMKDATACCQSAGVSLPGGSLDSEHPEELAAGSEQKNIECGICCEEVSAQDAGSGGCGHVFCSGCWGRYLRGRVCEGEPRPACPAPRCRRAAPHHLLQRCLTPRTQRKYLLFDIKAFVESSKGMKWCPIAGCGRAVKLHETELSIPIVSTTATDENEDECPGGYLPVSRGVDCGDFHFFCWECNSEPHPPLGCATWARWIAKTGAAPQAPLSAAVGGAESAASSLWLLAHCKPCPSCSCPIQKNDGCNHMKCTKCKFDFCWVCLESWKRHGSATGGYFRCTREEATARAEQSRGTAIAEARIQNVEAQEQWRFALQCSRYRRHEQEWSSERPLIIVTSAKVKALDHNNSSNGAIENSARELGLCRRVLAGCCAYTFLMPITAPHRAAFHYAQEELERCVVRLSNLIACEVIEAPLLALKRATAAARRWRLAIMRLVRPPPPPATISAQEIRMMARLIARGRLDPRDPWRFPLGPKGEPLRIQDPLDPDYPIPQVHKEPQALPSSRTVQERSTPVNDGDVYRINVSEYNMDLIIALEMSRLQMLEEQARRGQDSDGSSTSQDTTLPRNRQRPARLNISVSIGASSDNEDKNLSDDQLKLAIQLSLQEPGARFRQVEMDSDEKLNAESMVGIPGQSKESSGLHSLEGPSWSITKERRETSQEDLIDAESSMFNRLSSQEESWSRAADITVGYFLKALGRTQLDIPNLEVGLDILGSQKDKVVKNYSSKQSITKVEANRSNLDDASAMNSGLSDVVNYCNEGPKSRPPLLRSGVAGQRPPLLRQLGGKVRRSWSMGDISIRSSSTDDTTCNRVADESIQVNDLVDLDISHVETNTLPHCSKSQYCTDFERISVISKCIQIDAHTQQPETYTKSSCDNECYKSNSNISKNLKEDARKKINCYPKNLPWGEFCCEKKCVKTNLTETMASSHKKERHLSKSSNIVVPETDMPPKTVSVDWRGKVDPEVFDFNEKTIHLPDLHSSHLKVNTYLTKMAINKHTALLGDSPKHLLNQSDSVMDSFRRHSDHIPRGNDRFQNKVKASSSEKHIKFVRSAQASPERSRLQIATKDAKQDSPKKSKIEKVAKSTPTLSIKISDDSQESKLEEGSVKTKRGLETDSSNECESETGIPKSPTLYISGVSICREPSMKEKSFKTDQRSPKARHKSKSNGNPLPTSPVIVHVTSPSLSPCSERNLVESMSSCSATSPARERRRASRFSDESLSMLDVPVLPPSHFSDDVFYDEDDPALMMDCSIDSIRNTRCELNRCGLTGTVYAGCHGGGIMISNMPTLTPLKSDRSDSNDGEALYENVFPQSSDSIVFDMSLPNSPISSKSGQTMHRSRSARPLLGSQDFAPEIQTVSKLKSRSANEPERDREMFHFPKSSTDGALSSVLHVQESNLSSDDFHEALFLLERSPKTRDSKRRKRSKKRDKPIEKKSEQNKMDDENEAVERESPLMEQDEASSAL